MRKIFPWREIIAATCLSSSHCLAADIRPVTGSEFGCTVLMHGKIVEGDLEKLQDTVAGVHRGDEFNDPPMLCLDSPGGSLLEGIEIAQWIFNGVRPERDFRYFAFGTAIPEGATCVSACAIVFMAGRKLGNAGTGPGPFRILHPTGNLGFHGPGLAQVPSNESYTAEQLLQVFQTATDAAAAFTALTRQNFSGLRVFPPELLELVLSTPPDEMHYIRRVGEAAAWNISIWPVNRRPTGDGYDLTANAIANLESALRQERTLSAASAAELFSNALPDQQIRSEYTDLFSSGGRNSIVFIQPFGQGQYSNQLYFRPEPQHGREFAELRSDLREGSAWRSLPDAGYLFFHPDTPIGELYDHRGWAGQALSGYRMAEDVMASLSASNPAANGNHPQPTWCPNANSLVDRTICNDPMLSAIDIKIGEVFQLVRGDNDARALARLRLSERNACGSDVECLVASTSQTLELLREFIR